MTDYLWLKFLILFSQIIKSMLEENNEEPGAKYSLVAMETTEKLQRICSNIVGYCKTVMSLTGIDTLILLLIPLYLSPLFWRFLLFLFICIRCDVWAGYNITHTVTLFEGQVKGWRGGGGAEMSNWSLDWVWSTLRWISSVEKCSRAYACKIYVGK